MLPHVNFATLLRRYRLAIGLSQEELAERAHLSAQAIGALERGNRQTPRKETIDLLAEALSLTGPERAAFEAAARRQRAASPPTSTLPASEAVPLETTQPPEERVLLPTGPSSSSQVVQPARFLHILHILHIRWHGKLVVGLASVLLVLLLFTGLMAGIHAFSGGGTLCLATDFTTNLSYSSTTPLQRAVILAVTQNQQLGKGYQLQLSTYHDPPLQEGGPATGAHNVEQIVQNHCMMGMVGPFMSDVAAAEMPIAANAGLVMISPTNNSSGLTLRDYAGTDGYSFDQLHPPGKPPTYFRIAPTLFTEGAEDAAFTFQALGARSTYVVSDRTPYGEELAAGFTQRFAVKGGTIVRSDGIPSGNASVIADLAAKIAATNPDVVFYGGYTGSGAELKAQLVQQGYTGPFVAGGDIAYNPGFVTQAGANAANGTFATYPAVDLGYATSDVAARFIRAYTAHYPYAEEEYLTPDTAEAYDAAMVLITAIKQVIQAGGPVTRAAVLEQVRHIQYTGVIGPISFDENGDIVHSVFTMYTVQAGQWVYYQQLSA
jgi:branched-chain amino acid transport system substrate-binding protein